MLVLVLNYSKIKISEILSNESLNINKVLILKLSKTGSIGLCPVVKDRINLILSK